MSARWVWSERDHSAQVAVDLSVSWHKENAKASPAPLERRRTRSAAGSRSGGLGRDGGAEDSVVAHLEHDLAPGVTAFEGGVGGRGIREVEDLVDVDPYVPRLEQA